jgi:hypothetical protein
VSCAVFFKAEFLLLQIQQLNAARVLNVYHECKDLYERRMRAGLEEENVVLAEPDLEDFHQENVLAALAHFQTSQGRPLSTKLSEDLRKVKTTLFFANSNLIRNYCFLVFRNSSTGFSTIKVSTVSK